jgi:hypothetical protein
MSYVILMLDFMPTLDVIRFRYLPSLEGKLTPLKLLKKNKTHQKHLPRWAQAKLVQMKR